VAVPGRCLLGGAEAQVHGRWVLEQAAAHARVAPQEKTMPQEATMAQAHERANR
jgi:hypothetical protein